MRDAAGWQQGHLNAPLQFNQSVPLPWGGHRETITIDPAPHVIRGGACLPKYRHAHKASHQSRRGRDAFVDAPGPPFRGAGCVSGALPRQAPARPTSAPRHCTLPARRGLPRQPGGAASHAGRGAGAHAAAPVSSQCPPSRLSPPFFLVQLGGRWRGGLAGTRASTSPSLPLNVALSPRWRRRCAAAVLGPRRRWWRRRRRRLQRSRKLWRRRRQQRSWAA